MSHIEPIKIAIAFDQQLVADGLEVILSNQNNIEVVGLIENKENVIDLIPGLNPHIVIFEFLFWMERYIGLMSKLHLLFPDLKILIISELVSEKMIKLIMPHVNGYLLKTCSSEKMILAVHEIFETGIYLCPKAIGEFFKCTRTVKNDTELTEREQEVLCTWMESKGNNEIAGNLNISESTVRTHMNNIRQKLGNLNHLQLMIYACRQNIMNRNFRPICPNCRSFCG
jgi:DNA-binding NarL/FixJ family response regulator